MESEILEKRLKRKLTDEEGRAVHFWNQNGAGISAEKWKEVKELYMGLCADAGVEVDRDPLASEQDISVMNFKAMLLIAFVAIVAWTVVTFIFQEYSIR